jgi:hypothetical protein
MDSFGFGSAQDRTHPSGMSALMAEVAAAGELLVPVAASSFPPAARWRALGVAGGPVPQADALTGYPRETE